MGARADDGTYTSGRNKAHAPQLQAQAGFLTFPIHHLLADAGLEPGMKVLDLGSGAGDVALYTAEIVGPTGSVTGIDIDATILETARQRVAEAGYANVRFIVGDIRTVELDDDFDAIVGQFIWMHITDPATALRSILRHLRPGGIVTAYEPDYSTLTYSYPPGSCPSLHAAVDWIQQALRAIGAETAMGYKLHQMFIDAGLPAPTMLATAPLGAGPQFLESGVAYVTEMIRSFSPVIVGNGIATEEEIGIDTLAQRLLDEASAPNVVTRSIFYMSAWTRKPEA